MAAHGLFFAPMYDLTGVGDFRSGRCPGLTSVVFLAVVSTGCNNPGITSMTPFRDGGSAIDAGQDAGLDTGPEVDGGTETDGGPNLVGRPELRGVWITRFAFNTAADLEGIIDRAAAAGFNAVFLQVRGAGDAFYRSSHEPWSQQLTGTLGRDPGWDPLEVGVARAHGHGMELHAYFNALSGWPAGSLPARAEGTVQHMLYDHPDWKAVNEIGVTPDEEYVWITPASTAARAHIVATAEELLERYAVDGLHLDRIRTAGPEYSYDPATRAAWETARAGSPSLTLDDFVPGHMTESINALVAELYAAIGRARPAVKLSAAVWGIYTRASPGSCTGATSQGLDYYQDSLAWASRGTIDALVPMMYWPMAPGRCTDWARLLAVFMGARADRHIWAGMHALNLSDGSRWDFPGVVERIEHARTVGAQGTVVFASTYLDRETNGWLGYTEFAGGPGPFAEPGHVPPMPWK